VDSKPTFAAKWPIAGSTMGSASKRPCLFDVMGGSASPALLLLPEVSTNVSVTPRMPDGGLAALHPLVALR